MVANSRHHSSAGRSWIERNKLANRIVIANDELARLASIFQILGNGSNAGKLKNGVVLTHRRAAFDHDVSVDFCTSTDLNARSDNGIRPDFYVAIQFRLRAYLRGSVYLAHALFTEAPRTYAIAISMAEISAWATILPSTVAIPCIRQNEPRRFTHVSSIRS